MPQDFRIALVTCPPEVAETIARQLVDAGLAACVNIIPAVRSIYRWRGETRSDTECLLMAKTDASTFGALREAVLAAHPYELPEIVAVQISDAHTPYLQWISDNLR